MSDLTLPPETMTRAPAMRLNGDPALPSLGPDLRVCVIGASGGLGGAFVARLAALPTVARIDAYSRQAPAAMPTGVAWFPLDITDEAKVAEAAATAGDGAPLNLVVVATGLLHDGDRLQPEKTWRALDGAALERTFRINTVGPALVAKHFLPRLAKGRKTAFAALSARVGSISDNRAGGWHAYRASKAALNMIIRTLAVELTHRNPDAVCLALHPGTVDTGLSKPFRRNVAAGGLFTPERSAGALMSVIDGAGPTASGRLFAWDGQEVLP